VQRIVEESVMDYGNPTMPAGVQDAQVRTEFMQRVYTRLVMGVAAFVLFEAFLFTSGLALAITQFVFSTSWLLILGGFMIVSWLSNSLTHRASSPGAEWGGYLLLVAANALIFAPMLVIADLQVPGTVAAAGQYTIAGFIILSIIAHRSARDFTWIGASLRWIGVLALVAIVLSVITGFQLGTWFSLGMIGFAGAAILYETQVILRETPPGRETMAAMALFSSLALLFWYVLRLFMERR
jgi:FtsH-binding integral membrane protein